jgi:mRNA interferase RelE/StbE
VKTPEIVVAPAAKRELRKLECGVQKLVIGVIETLSTDPRPQGVEKLQGHPKFYRIAAGKNHRIIYHILRNRLVVILLVRDRKDAYRNLGDLDGKLSAALIGLEDRVRAIVRATG